jgi:hypothetical protein
MLDTTIVAPSEEAVRTPDAESVDIHDLSDREASDALVRGAVLGFVLVFVIAWAIAMGVGLGPATAAAVATWPAVVGGPFFGSLAFLVSALLRHERSAPAEEADAVTG